MVQLPFSATAAAVLLIAMIAGGAVGVATWSPASDSVPATQARAEPSVTLPAPPAAPAMDEAASQPQPQTQTGAVEQTAVTQLAAPQDPSPSQQEVTVNQQVSIEQTESTTTTIVAAPVIVTNLGPAWSCVGCIEHKNPPHPAAEANHANHPVERHAAVAPRHEMPPPHFFHPEHIAVAAAHSR